MTELSGTATVEKRQLVLLLSIVAIFYFILIPIGVIDPEGYGIDQGLPPSFSPKLVSYIATLLMLFRLGHLHFKPSSAVVPSITDEDDGLSLGFPRRGLLGMTAAVVFSQILIPFLGFYLASSVLLIGLLITLGEKNIGKLIVYPMIVIAAVWGLFDQLLSIRLPAGLIF